MRQQNIGHVRQVTDHQTEPVADIVNIHTVSKELPASYKVVMEVNDHTTYRDGAGYWGHSKFD